MHTGHSKILIIDDEEMIRQTTSVFLEKFGFSAISAPDGTEGLDMFRRYSPDAVLLDLRLPGVDGLEVLKTLNEESPETPVIVISGAGNIQDVIEAQRIGAWDYITKPISDMQIIIQTLNKAREKSELIRQKENYNQYLKDIVYQRTEELVMSNKKLKEEINERRKKEEEINQKNKELHGMISALKKAHEELKESHTALKDSEERYNALFDRSLEAVFIYDYKGHFVDANEVALKLTGYEKSDIMKHDLTSLLEGEHLAKAVDVLNEIKETGVQKEIAEYKVRRKDGSYFWIENKTSPIYKNGEPYMLLGVARDITKRKQSEEEILKFNKELEQRIRARTGELEKKNRELQKLTEELSESEKRYRFLAESSTDVIWTTDEIINTTYISPSITRLTGYTQEEAMSKKPHEVFTPDSLKKLTEIVVEEVEKDKIKDVEPTRSRTLEFEQYRKDGTTIWIECTATILRDPDGKIIGFHGVNRDITDRVAARREMQKAKEEAEKANRAKSEFLANMSHEIRTPLNNIIGFLDLLKNTGLNKKQLEYLSIAKSSSYSLLDILNDILDLAKIENQKLEIENIEFSPREEFEIAIEFFAFTADEKNIEMISFIDPLLPEKIQGDPLRIRQILTNLISNAIKFTPEEGRIYIEITVREITDSSCSIFFLVSDTGIGINKNNQKMILEAFTQADGSITRRYGGTGLGLTISTNLLKLMGGELEINSQEGEGSEFSFELSFSKQKGKKLRNIKSDFQNISFYIYYENNKKKHHVRCAERYLKSMGASTEVFSNKNSLEEDQDGKWQILIAEHSSIESLLETSWVDPSKILIIIISTKLSQCIPPNLQEERSKIICQPLNESKIMDAVMGLVHGPQKSNKLPDNETLAKRFEARVLIGEDNEINQMLTSMMLQNIGIEVEIAENGREVVKKFQSGSYDLILMDIHMPEMDGFEAAKKMKEIEKKKGLKHTPVIALTAIAMRGDRETILERGMDDYISKPVDIKNLSDIFSKYLKQKEVTS